MRKSLLLAGAAALLIGSGNLVYAQLEGADRGIPPIDSTSNFEVTGIDVDVSAKTASEARLEGWKRAQRLGWTKLWSRTTGKPEAQAPEPADAVLNQIVSGIVIENEQIGPSRYVARLGVLFDRARTGQMLGVTGETRRSAPMLLIPVMRTGSTGYALEFRNPWQYAWAQFRTANSPIDYVRPVGNGIDPLLLNAAQMGRRSRGWWRALLDQYGGSDVVIPEVQLSRAFPGGPAVGRFVARYGPDADIIGSFELRAASEEEIPRMMAEGVQRMDALYTQAFNAGMVRPDPTLIPPPPEFLPPPPPIPGAEPLRRRAAPPPPPRPAYQDEAVTEEVVPVPAPTPRLTPLPPTPPVLPPEPQLPRPTPPPAPAPR